MRRLLLSSLVALLLVLAGGAALLWWLHHPLPMARSPIDLSIEPGTSPREVAQAVADAGVSLPPELLLAWFRVSGQDRKIRAGSYELEQGLTPRSLLAILIRGEEANRSVVLVEGWNFKQLRAALARAEWLKKESTGLSDEALMQRLGRAGVAPEGRFFPDTYTYAKNSSDLALLQRALRAMDKHLASAWAMRDSEVPLKGPEEALVLASIVEKETGRAAERAQIAGVFANRLRLGMPLQTDPTVIYGLGSAFDGNLRRKDLHTDTPWNTYTRTGLPPTPIAMPGRAALLAAVLPARSKALYFVARGDGSSEFSASLDAHNRAVNKYQMGR